MIWAYEGRENNNRSRPAKFFIIMLIYMVIAFVFWYLTSGFVEGYQFYACRSGHQAWNMIIPHVTRPTA
jgi:hypothetical protein